MALIIRILPRSFESLLKQKLEIKTGSFEPVFVTKKGPIWAISRVLSGTTRYPKIKLEAVYRDMGIPAEIITEATSQQTGTYAVLAAAALTWYDIYQPLLVLVETRKKGSWEKN